MSNSLLDASRLKGVKTSESFAPSKAANKDFDKNKKREGNRQADSLSLFVLIELLHGPHHRQVLQHRPSVWRLIDKVGYIISRGQSLIVLPIKPLSDF